ARCPRWTRRWPRRLLQKPPTPSGPPDDRVDGAAPPHDRGDLGVVVVDKPGHPGSVAAPQLQDRGEGEGSMSAGGVTATGNGVGPSPVGPDGTLKVTGEFAFSSDLWADRMLWGATLRSPHPRARIVGIDLTAAVATTGVHAVLTAEDVPGAK